jgi:hypothetical protein
MAAPTRTQLERWASFGKEGLVEMSAWLAENPGHPFAATVQQIVTTTQVQLTALLVIAKKILRVELVVQKAQIQAQIDAITAEVGP